MRHYHAQQDYENAFDAITHLSASDEEAQAYMNYLLARTRTLLAVPGVWDEVIALADSLLEHRKLSGRQATGVIRKALPQAG